MLSDADLKKEVTAAVNGDGGESSAPEQPKEVASPEVKTETPPTEPEKPAETPVEPPRSEKPINVNDLQKQIENLNVAIKKEREEGRAEKESLAKELRESTTMLERLKGAFAPAETPAEPEPATSTYLTPEQAEEIWEKKEQERLQKDEEAKRVSAITSEISKLETEWNGKDGKPKYDDQEVLEWQKSINKLYLSPQEAFSIMKQKEILDYELKQRLAGKKPTQEVETPSTTPGGHEPGETLPKTEAETRKAIMEAINNAEAEI